MCLVPVKHLSVRSFEFIYHVTWVQNEVLIRRRSRYIVSVAGRTPIIAQDIIAIQYHLGRHFKLVVRVCVSVLMYQHRLFFLNIFIQTRVVRL